MMLLTKTFLIHYQYTMGWIHGNITKILTNVAILCYNIRMNIRVAAGVAELMVSPEYRGALNDAFAADPEAYQMQRDETLHIAEQAIRANKEPEQAAWDMRRRAAIASLGGVSLGPFNDFVQEQGGTAPATHKSVEELAGSELEIVRTNNRVVSLKDFYEDPIDYLDAALDLIDARRSERTGGKAIGPENYATAIKLFTDKYNDFPSKHLDEQSIKMRIDACMDGFLRVAKHDKPNFVEMTNIYAAIAHLPRGVFDARFTKELLRHSLEQLPDYDQDRLEGNGTLLVLIGALGKLDLSPAGEEAGTLLDLVLRKAGKLDRTTDFLRTLSALRNLPSDTRAADRSFVQFLRVRNNLENALDINACDYANEQLLHIAQHVVSEPLVVQYVQELAHKVAKQSVLQLKEEHRSGNHTERALAQLKATVQHTVDAAQQI